MSLNPPRLVYCCPGTLQHSLSQFGKHLGGILDWQFVVFTNKLEALHESHTLETRVAVVEILRTWLEYKNINHS